MPALTLAPLPDPVWPVVVLAVLLLADAAVGLRRPAFVVRCYEDVAWPPELWWTVPSVKIAAGVALLVGIRLPYLAAAASVGVVAFFVVAAVLHVRARDIGRNLAGATTMLVLAAAATALALGGTA